MSGRKGYHPCRGRREPDSSGHTRFRSKLLPIFNKPSYTQRSLKRRMLPRSTGQTVYLSVRVRSLPITSTGNPTRRPNPLISAQEQRPGVAHGHREFRELSAALTPRPWRVIGDTIHHRDERCGVVGGVGAFYPASSLGSSQRRQTATTRDDLEDRWKVTLEKSPR